MNYIATHRETAIFLPHLSYNMGIVRLNGTGIPPLEQLMINTKRSNNTTVVVPW